MREVLLLAGIASLAAAGYSLMVHINRTILIKRRLAAIGAAKRSFYLKKVLKQYTFLEKLSFKLAEYINYTGSRFNPEMYITICFILALVGAVIGTNILNSRLTGMVLAIWFGTSPIIWLQTKVDRKKSRLDKMAIDFLHDFLNRYTEERNIRKALVAVDVKKYQIMKSELMQLQDRLNSGDALGDTLNDFVGQSKNRWLKYFADIVSLANKTGAGISGPVSNLIAQLQRSEKRLRKSWVILLVYRLLFLFLSFVAFISYYWLSQKVPRTFYYFTQTALGKNLMFFSSILMMVCFLVLMLQRR